MWASRIEIARAFIAARRRMGWTRAQLRAHQQAHLSLEDGPIETSREYELVFAKRNVLGLNLEAARREAARELAGRPPTVTGFSWGFSTGTLGTGNVFLTSDRERNAWVGTVLGKFLPWRMLAGCEVALVLKHNSRLYSDTGKTRRIGLHYFEASVAPTEWADRMCSLAPQVLVGPPSLLEELARSKEFEKRPFRPELLLAGAEPLFPQDRHFLESRYGVAPRVIYQAKEGFLAAGCRQGGIHLNEDLVYFERIEIGGGRFVPVISDFTRTSQTYRRFRLDDVLIEGGGGCRCGQGFANIAAVEGRANDVLMAGEGLVFPLAVNELVLQHLAPGERRPDYHITQARESEVAVGVEGGVSSDLVEALGRMLRPATVVCVPYEKPRPGEKRRRVRRWFDLHNDWLNRFSVSRKADLGR
jgi:putative adenylate-forming enzyme